MYKKSRFDRTYLASLLLAGILLFGCVSCSTILRTEIFQPESVAKNEWIPFPPEFEQPSALPYVILKHQQGAVSFLVSDVRPTLSLAGPVSSITFGPIFFPIIPVGWFKFYPLHLSVTVESLENVTTVQFHHAEIYFFREEVIQPRAVYLVGLESKDTYSYNYTSILETKHGRLVEPGDFTLSKEKRMFELDFFKIPSTVEEFTVNFGRIKIDDNEIELPVKYRKVTKYRYMPLFFGE